MKKTALLSVLVLVLASMSFAFSIDGNIYSAGVTRYLWRGMDLNDNGPAIQPGLSLSAEGLTLEAWSSCQQFYTPDMFDEIDLYANYEHTIPYAEFLTVGIGYASYILNPSSNYPNIGTEQTDEISVTLKSDVISNPYVTLSHSLEAETTYNYLEAGVSYEYEFGEILGGNIAAGAEASIGMDLNFVTYEVDETTFEVTEKEEAKLSAAALNLYVSYAIGDFTITPSCLVQLALNDTEIAEGQKLYNNLAAGSLMVNYNFTLGQKEEAKEESKSEEPAKETAPAAETPAAAPVTAEPAK